MHHAIYNNLSIDDILTIEKGIPIHDFINKTFDCKYAEELPKRVIIILSTPRTGSTFLCDTLKNAGVCVAHEYFQPYQYIPILAQRWSVYSDSRIIDFTKYFECLIRNRTSINGTLGINVHGEHLPMLNKFMKLYPNLTYNFIWLKRDDIKRQAISYEIAFQTHKWTMHFKSNIKEKFSYEGVCNKLNSINNQNLDIACFLEKNKCIQETIILKYETFIADIGIIIDMFNKLNIPYASKLLNYVSNENISSLKKQSNRISEKWNSKFIKIRCQKSDI